MKQKHLFFVIFILLSSGIIIGQIWDHQARLTYTSGISFYVRVATDSINVVHVVWSDDTSGNNEIYYKNCDNGGTGTWSALKRLTWNAGESVMPAIAIDSNDKIHIVWMDDSVGNEEIYHKTSTDGGTTWSAPIRVTWTSGSSKYPAIAVSASDWLRLVYCEYVGVDLEIFYKECAPGSSNWSGLKRLTYTSGFATYPWIGADGQGAIGGYIHVVWQDDSVGNDELYHKLSTDNGDTWSSVQRVTYNSGDSMKPYFVFADNNTLRLVWYDDSSGNQEIYYKERAPGTGIWSGLTRLTWTPGATNQPTIAIDGNQDVHVVYANKPSNRYDLYHKKSTDTGASWSAVTRITWTWNNCHWPRIVVSGTDDHIHLVYIGDSSGNAEVYFKRGNQTILH